MIVTFLTGLGQTNMAETIVNIVLTLPNQNDISPKGVVSLLTVIHEAIFYNYKQLLHRLFKDNYARSLTALLSETQMQALYEWPLMSGGGSSAVTLVAAQILRILNLPFAQQNSEKELEVINKELYRCEVVPSTIKAMKYLNQELISIAITILSRLVFNTDSERKFAQQFVNNEGLKLITKLKLLKEDNSVLVITETLSILSQLTRLSKDYYERIHNLMVYRDLKNLLNHKDAPIRAKVCSLIGNMCRHSAYFYDHLLQSGLIEAAIERCKDSDRNTRKFACFAVGNAGFHNDSLYDSLRSCVPLLVALLKDSEDKTRANAAGALGNFVRNSSKLCKDLIEYGALKTLLEVVTGDTSVPPRRISLFSIGNLCQYSECRTVFSTLNLRQHIEPLLDSQDQQISKFAKRIIQKLTVKEI